MTRPQRLAGFRQAWFRLAGFRLAGHGLALLALTLLSQLGGLAWLLALPFRRRRAGFALAFALAYAALSVAAVHVAQVFGRVALSCRAEGPLQVQAWTYCALNRSYVVPELAAVLDDTAAAMDTAFPGTVTQVLDAGFPFGKGFPLLPHLSHDDGEKVDLAFYYADAGGYLPGQTRAPLGYFAFEPGESPCAPAWPSLRWNLAALQPLWPDWQPDAARMRHLLALLSADPRVGKVFVEPHLVARWGAGHEKIRFQGCGAARHDDHIHLQL